MAKARTITLGDPLDRATKMGPLVTAAAPRAGRGLRRAGQQRGRPAGAGRQARRRWRARDGGAFVEPTIFDDVAPGMRIAQEEIFGPVVVGACPSTTRTRRSKIANDTPYGLAGAVWTRDIFRAFRVVKQLRAGIIWVNHMQPTYVEAPWGGYKMSGHGRELGRYGIEGYLETKQVHVNLSEKPIGWY